MCHDESDWDRSERFHLVAVRLGKVNREWLEAVKRAEPAEKGRLMAEQMGPSREILESVKGSELSENEGMFVMFLSMGAEIGAISVAGETHIASFGVEGINRRWDWSPHEDGGYDDALIIQPSGNASYINFRGADKNDEGTRQATADALFQCEQG